MVHFSPMLKMKDELDLNCKKKKTFTLGSHQSIVTGISKSGYFLMNIPSDKWIPRCGSNPITNKNRELRSEGSFLQTSSYFE